MEGCVIGEIGSMDKKTDLGEEDDPGEDRWQVNEGHRKDEKRLGRGEKTDICRSKKIEKP